MPKYPLFALLSVCVLMAHCVLSASGAEPQTANPLPDGTAAALQTIAGLRTAPGLQIELWAAEPQLSNPVAISIDAQGNLFVAEEYRFSRGTPENRRHGFLLEDDLQIHTLEDRSAMYAKWGHMFPGGHSWLTNYTDQVRMLSDSDGDGRADRSSVFASGFNDELDGLAAGVLAHHGDVYLTCIPSLWKLRDTDGDGQADVRQSLLRGFGVRASYLGHDLHGLIVGPDGRLYFSIGDRGFHVQTHEGTILAGANHGAVFRCEPNGDHLQVVARGLRNPQELAFDQYGNLFAADNNCDKGDHARLVYVVEGGDSGWRMEYQTMEPPYLVGPWHAERMWYLEDPLQPAFIVPPVGAIGTGPSGFAYDPGTGLPDEFRNRFFLCNFTGNNGGIETFGVEPHGAAFRLVDTQDFLKALRSTDLTFGYDGKLYVADFVDVAKNSGDDALDGGSLGGRIYTVSASNVSADADASPVAILFREGFSQRSPEELIELLAHADMRVRQEAQFALVHRGAESADALFQIASSRGDDLQLARLHAVWGLGQLLRRGAIDAQPLLALLQHEDPETRAQVVTVIGDAGSTDGAGAIVDALADESPRVRFFAGVAVGKLHLDGALDALIQLLHSNDDVDPYLRHAAVMGLAGIGDRPATLAVADHPSATVRMGVLLTLRQWGDERVQMFLHDEDPKLQTEAAWAIYDLPIPDALPALADMAQTLVAEPGNQVWPDGLVRRVINSNYRLGGKQRADAVASMLGSFYISETMQAEIIAVLSDWTAPPPRDRVNGLWNPLPPRSTDELSGVTVALSRLWEETSGTTRAQAIHLWATLNDAHSAAQGAADVASESQLVAWSADPNIDVPTRIAALEWSQHRYGDTRRDLIDAALSSDEPELRAAGRDLIAAADPMQAAMLFRDVLESASTTQLEKQRAFATLAGLTGEGADALLAEAAQRLAAGELPAALQLDVLEATKGRDNPRIKAAIRTYRQSLDSADPLADLRVCLQGGDAERGYAVFTGHVRAQCMRCHKIHETGGDAGPELTHVAGRNVPDIREYLLESIAEPNAKIALRFGTVTVQLDDGRLIVGSIQEDSPDALRLITVDGAAVTIDPATIEERTQPASPMPAMKKSLSLPELRDLVEFLSTLE